MSVSTRSPAGIQGPRERAQTRGPAPTLNSNCAPSLPTSAQDSERGEGGKARLVNELESRGVVSVTARSLTSQHPSEQIEAAIAYWDQQRAGSVGAGVLVLAVREGRQPCQAARSADSSVDRRGAEERELWAAWAREHMPELLVNGELHLGAHAGLFRLGVPVTELSVASHGDRLRGWVANWEQRFGEAGGQ